MLKLKKSVLEKCRPNFLDKIFTPQHDPEALYFTSVDSFQMTVVKCIICCFFREENNFKRFVCAESGSTGRKVPCISYSLWNISTSYGLRTWHIKKASCFYKFSWMEVIAVDVCFVQHCINFKLQQKYLSKVVGVFRIPVSQARAIAINMY